MSLTSEIRRIINKCYVIISCMKMLLINVVVYALAMAAAFASGQNGIIVAILLMIMGALISLSLTPWMAGTFRNRCRIAIRYGFMLSFLCYLVAHIYSIVSVYLLYV